MCLLIYRAPNGENPTSELLRAGFASNPHGAGYAFTRKGKVHYRKGLLTADALLASINSARIPADSHLIVHLRFATHGAKSPGLTHPFPITHERARLEALKGCCDGVFAHNGILSCTVLPGLSDTASFVAHTYSAPDVFLATGHNEMHGLLDRAVMGSKVVELTPYGPVFFGESWIRRAEGLYLSNENFLEFDDDDDDEEYSALWDMWKKDDKGGENERMIPCRACGNDMEVEEDCCPWCFTYRYRYGV